MAVRNGTHPPGDLDTRFLDLSRRTDVDTAVTALAAGRFVAHPFANIYAISSRPDAATVRALNLLKGRPVDQVGSVTTTRDRAARLFDWTALPAGLDAGTAITVVDALLALGPFGFRGPAAAHVPAHLSATDRGIRTVQLIAPGGACPANHFLTRCLDAVPAPYLYVTSANRSHRVTGAVEEPAHFRAAPLARDFAGTELLVLRGNESRARTAYPLHARTSTTVLALHRTALSPSGRRALVVERHGSLPVDAVRRVLRSVGWDAVLAPPATRRLPQRDDHGSETGP